MVTSVAASLGGGVGGGGRGVRSLALPGVAPRGGGGGNRLPGVGPLGHEPVGVVRRVGGRLDTTVGEGDREGASDVSGSVLGLRLPEVGLAVVVGDSVLVGVGLGGQLLLHVGGLGGVLGGGQGHQGQGGQDLEHGVQGVGCG